MTDFLSGLLAGSTPPVSDHDWLQLDIQASATFSPHTPIDEQDLFAGRVDLIDRLIDVIFQAGQHAILYGERGVGKSSLANIIKEKIFNTAKIVQVIKRNCTSEHTYRLIWQHVFSDFELDGTAVRTSLAADCNSFDIMQILNTFPETSRPVIVIDEFDRVKDEKTKVMMSDTIKYLSDYGSKTTLIMVGVAQSVRDLFIGHESIGRCLEQIPMRKMDKDELTQIIDYRLPLLNMDMDNRIKRQIVALSQGFPGYTHLLGQAATRSAISRRSLNIQGLDLKKAIEIAIAKSDETIKENYGKAVRSTKPKNQYKQALLSCALAKADVSGYFNAAAVREEFSKIMKRRMEIPAFARHLNEFCDVSRGPALVKEGKPKSFEYRFADALLRPYVVIRGIQDGLIRNGYKI